MDHMHAYLVRCLTVMTITQPDEDKVVQALGFQITSPQIKCNLGAQTFLKVSKALKIKSFEIILGFA